MLNVGAGAKALNDADLRQLCLNQTRLVEKAVSSLDLRKDSLGMRV